MNARVQGAGVRLRVCFFCGGTRGFAAHILGTHRREWPRPICAPGTDFIMSLAPKDHDYKREYLDMGPYSRKVSTRSAGAQIWFDRGLNWLFGFNHEEAVCCFERALVHDPMCAMAMWGVAYAKGVNYNNPVVMDAQGAFEASRKAANLAERARGGEAGRSITDVEFDLISALTKRYVWPTEEEKLRRASSNTKGDKAEPARKAAGEGLGLDETGRLQVLFRNEMRRVYTKHGNDSEVASVYAESMMNLRSWKLWEPEPGSDPPAPPAETLVIVRLLERHLARAPQHPGLCHLYIHTMELSPTPEKALPQADALLDQGGLVPGSGHLLHMASHIDMWVGQYERAILSNALAFKADAQYLRITKHAGGIYLAYRMHSLHFLVWAAMFDGQFRLALHYAREVQRQLSTDVLKATEGMAEYCEGFVISLWMVFVRFGRWDEVLTESVPKDPTIWPCVIAAAHYARGVAYAAQGRVDRAKAEQALFEAAIRRPECKSRWLHTNRVVDQEGTVGILNVAQAVLRGEVLYREKKYDEAFAALREAVRRDDGLNYDEPWGWMQPARHALGALLCEQQRFQEAKAVFQADLKKWPRNLWALKGLAQAEAGLGDSKRASQADKLFQKVAKRLDVPLAAPCFCASQSKTETKASEESCRGEVRRGCTPSGPCAKRAKGE